MAAPRIAYVMNSVEGGGAALPVPSVLAVAREAGAEVRVFALARRDGRAVPALERVGIDVVVREGGGRDHLAALRWLDCAVRDHRPSHLWTSLTRATLLGQLVGLRRGVPVVSWQHAAWLKPANLRLLRATRRLSRLWIADSSAVAGYCRARLGIPEARLMAWPIFRADPAAPPATPWRPGEPIRIGSLGRRHPGKGYDCLLTALAALPPDGPAVELSVAGDGRERAALEEQVRRLGLRRIAFVGYVEEPRRWLAGLHLYVQPSRSEGFCIAAHEAMQAGLPVIASQVGELPGSIDDGVTGWLVPPGDPEGLARVLGQALRAPRDLAPVGRAARGRVLDRHGPARFRDAGLAVMARIERLQ
jgi:glycosyltransferase involved in cell wall biosynthesis